MRGLASRRARYCLACAARRVKRIACVRYSSCMSRFTIAVRCCPAGWLCACCVGYRWRCGAVLLGTLCAGCVVLCAARGRAGICLFSSCCVVLVCSGVRRGAAVLLCGVSGLLVYCLRLPALRVLLCYLLLLSYCLHVLPSVSPTVCHPSSVRRSLVSAAPRSLCVSSDTISL